MAGKSQMTLFPAVPILWNIWISIYTIDNDNVIANVELTIDNTFCV